MNELNFNYKLISNNLNNLNNLNDNQYDNQYEEEQTIRDDILDILSFFLLILYFHYGKVFQSFLQIFHL